MKTSKLVGWPHTSLSHQNQTESWNSNNYSVTPVSNNYPVTSPNTAVITSTSNVAPKDAAMSTSLDSGVAGLRDTPVHIPTTNNNNNMPAPKATPAATDEHDVPKFIVDQTTRTTYMKGRFLGKVSFNFSNIELGTTNLRQLQIF